ncbi:hypothetical protein A9Q81_25695 [Gammaproteobacteria bacterium 42_54_T18]|nr:hypothetical protein A9Q81_25695 [Gammaproteobacteria bacterium 42_54_T18]
MLINSAIQSYAAIDSPVGRQVPGEGTAVRSDIPPIKEVVGTEQSKNGATNNNLPQPYTVEENDNSSEIALLGIPIEELPNSREGSSQTNVPVSDAKIKAQEREDELVISQLRARDQEVRVHEAAHAAVGGRYAGSPSLQFTRGPDGVNYAIAGEVSISTGKVSGDPQATIEKARVIRAAALAPASPSVQDRRVASQASQLESDARVELRVELREKASVEQSAQSEKADESDKEKVLKRLNEERRAEDAKDSPDTRVVVAQVTTESNDDSDTSDDEDETTDSGDAFNGERTTAKDRLEDILLSAKPIAVELNELGLIDAENPFGKSGLISLIV